MTTEELIRHLQLLPHPEGGYYRETYRAAEEVTGPAGVKRNVCTAIYFLLEGAGKSHFHRIRSDELWFFHTGMAVEIFEIVEGKLVTVVLGPDLEEGARPFVVIPANTWFAARVKDASGFSLVSCTVAPGFDFADFELAQRARLTDDFPDLEPVIAEFTRD